MGDNYPGSPVINIQHLKKCETDTTYTDRALLPNSFSQKPKSDKFEVEKIVGYKCVGKKATLKYLV